MNTNESVRGIRRKLKFNPFACNFRFFFGASHSVRTNKSVNYISQSNESRKLFSSTMLRRRSCSVKTNSKIKIDCMITWKKVEYSIWCVCFSFFFVMVFDSRFTLSKWWLGVHICSIDNVRMETIDWKWYTETENGNDHKIYREKTKNVDFKSTDNLIRFRCAITMYPNSWMYVVRDDGECEASIESGKSYHWNVSIQFDAFFNSISVHAVAVDMRDYYSPVAYIFRNDHHVGHWARHVAI